MTDDIVEIRSRRRIYGRPGRLSLDIATAAAQWSESGGLAAGQKWARDLLTELRAADTPAQVIIDLASVIDAVRDHVPEEVFAQVERAVVDAVAALSGHDS